MKIQIYEVAELVIVAPMLLEAEVCEAVSGKADRLESSDSDRRVLDPILLTKPELRNSYLFLNSNKD